jgi:hypothetical protein
MKTFKHSALVLIISGLTFSGVAASADLEGTVFAQNQNSWQHQYQNMSANDRNLTRQINSGGGESRQYRSNNSTGSGAGSTEQHRERNRERENYASASSSDSSYGSGYASRQGGNGGGRGRH